MSNDPPADRRPPPAWRDAVVERFYRVAASGVIPPGFFLRDRDLPGPADLPGRTGHLQLEIVSHCWRYAHLQAYQLSSLLLHPPQKLSVRMTVFHAPDDERVVELLQFFAAKPAVPNVTWNWWPLERPQLFRRAIGRNLAALGTTADWVWFTDCDVVFHGDCLDRLADALQGRCDRLVFPREEHVTRLLTSDDPLLQAAAQKPAVVSIDPERFSTHRHVKATGPIQITHGDMARRAGYCASLPYFQQPATRWRKTYEDRAFRWLLRTDGTPIDVPGVYRIKHLDKGRYRERHWTSWLRRHVRRLQQPKVAVR